MLRKRSRTAHKDQSEDHLIPDSAPDSCFSSYISVQKNKTRSFFSVRGVFVGFNPKFLSDYSDAASSPTSPLDYKGFSCLGNACRSPRKGPNAPQKSWDCSKVGLSIVDSLNDETKHSGKIVGFSETNNILFGSQMRINTASCSMSPLDSSASPKSLPKNYAISPQTPVRTPLVQSLGFNLTQLEHEGLGKIRSCSLDSGGMQSNKTSLMFSNRSSNSDNFWSDSKNTQQGSPLFGGGPNFEIFSGVKSNLLPVPIGSGNGLMSSLSACEIELSEYYTRVTSHGPNPRTTHIYGDCILESLSVELAHSNNKEERQVVSSTVLDLENGCLEYPSDNFLSFCYSCKKKLEEGKDIYMYRGEKAFCSFSCRLEEISIKEEMEKPTINSSYSSESDFCEEIFLPGMIAK